MSQSKAKSAKKKVAKEESQEQKTIEVAPEYLYEVVQQKLAEADNQNTLLRGLVMQQQAEINTLKAAQDALVAAPANREERRKKEKASGKRSK